MLAEICGKISSSGSNLSDQLEDKLTGDFFGTLRYLPFEKGLKHVLLGTNFNEQASSNFYRALIKSIRVDCLANNVYFWPKHKEGELDIILDFPNVIIGIEVKYLSGLSSDDDIDNSILDEYRQSINQLARESQIINSIRGIRPGVLLLVALESDAGYIVDLVLRRKILSDEITFGYLSWQGIYHTLATLSLNQAISPQEQTILGDLLRLLKKKGFERFRNFDLENQPEINNNEYFMFMPTLFDFDSIEEIVRREFYEFRE